MKAIPTMTDAEEAVWAARIQSAAAEGAGQQAGADYLVSKNSRPRSGLHVIAGSSSAAAPRIREVPITTTRIGPALRK